MKRIILFLALISPSLFAREIYFSSEVEPILLPAGSTKIFRFPEPVKTISQASGFVIKPADETAPDYATLSVAPQRQSGSSTVAFILGSGTTVNVKLTVMRHPAAGDTDSVYDFKPRSQLIEKESNAGSNITEMDLIKGMIRLDQVTGYAEQSVNQYVRTGIDGLAARLVQVYTGPKFQGLVFKLENKQKDREFEIDLESLVLGRPNGAIMSQLDRKLLSKKGAEGSSTYLRIVTKPSTVYSNINLPVTERKEK